MFVEACRAVRSICQSEPRMDVQQQPGTAGGQARSYARVRSRLWRMRLRARTNAQRESRFEIREARDVDGVNGVGRALGGS
eukprot:98634-Chlamydomonas_euryale.AAC.2